MQPSLLRFVSIRNEEDETYLTFARFTSNSIQFLANSEAYEVSIDQSPLSEHAIIPGARIQGTNSPLSTKLLNLLLHIPGTRARISTNSELYLKCRDVRGITLFTVLPLTRIATKNITQDLIHDLISATVSLESTLLEFSGGHNLSLDPLSEKEQNFSTVESLYNSCTPGNQKLESIVSFRKAAAGDLYMQSTRALVTAAKAKDVRNQIVEKRRIRKEEREQIVKKELSRMKQLRQRAAHQRKENDVLIPIAKNKKRSYFQFCDDEGDHDSSSKKDEAEGNAETEAPDRTIESHKDKPATNNDISSSQPKQVKELNTETIKPKKESSASSLKQKKKQKRKLV